MSGDNNRWCYRVTTVESGEKMEKKTKVIGEMDNSDGTFESANRVYDKRNAAPTIPTCGGGGIQPKTVRVIGGVGETHEFGTQFRQQHRVYDKNGLVPAENAQGITWLFTRRMDMKTEDGVMYIEDNELGINEQDRSIDKTVEDYLITAKDGEKYGIFKLSPRECLRLMGVRDNDIDKMLSVNSNSQCYKQAGNSISTLVLVAIFSQLHIKGCPVWNKISEEERQVIVDDAKGVYTK